MRIEDQAIEIQHLNEMGHLDHLFNVVEEKVDLVKEDEMNMFCVAIFDLASGKYHIDNPVTGKLGFVVAPKLFHGFIGVRYRELEDLGVGQEQYGYTRSPLIDFLEIAGNVTSGKWDVEGGSMRCIWLVNKVDGPSRAVILNGDLSSKGTGPQVNWYLEKFNPASRFNPEGRQNG